MTKPWEATWRWNEERCEIVSDQRDDLDNEIVIVETDGGCYPPRQGDQELIAAAPDMARVLLAIEWAGRAGPAGDIRAACPSCGADRSEMYDGRGPVVVVDHDADCALDAALRKAGVR